MTSLLETALRIADYKPQPFVAPIPIDGLVTVSLMQNGVPLDYAVRGEAPGWWEFKPNQKKLIRTRSAYANEISTYLQALPRFYTIACIPSGEDAWLCVPYSAADAEQRGWSRGEPKIVYLIDEHIEPFDVLVTRSMAGVLIYDSLDHRLGTFTISELCKTLQDEKPKQHDWLNAYNIIQEWQAKAEQEAILAKVQNEMASVENRMKFLLEFMGARLITNEKRGNGYQVTWQAPDGRTYKMGVREDGHISVAGFCLSGTDSQHNLSSIVQIMEEAHRLNRFDVHHAYADYDGNNDDDDFPF